VLSEERRKTAAPTARRIANLQKEAMEGGKGERIPTTASGEKEGLSTARLTLKRPPISKERGGKESDHSAAYLA